MANLLSLTPGFLSRSGRQIGARPSEAFMTLTKQVNKFLDHVTMVAWGGHRMISPSAPSALRLLPNQTTTNPSLDFD